MSANYCLSIATPQGTNVFKGNQWDSLSRLVSGDITRLVAARASDNQGEDLDTMAGEVLKVFKAYYSYPKRWCRSRIAVEGLELDLVKCFLQGLTISETVKWFKTHKGFKTSKTAVGRYWEVLHRIGIEPMGSFAGSLTAG